MLALVVIFTDATEVPGVYWAASRGSPSGSS